MEKSDVTKSYKKKYWTCQILSWIVTFLPLIIYVIIGFVNGEPHQKLTLGLSVMVSASLVAVNILMKLSLRSTIWILLLGIYFALDSIMILLLIVAIGTILDEFILTPLAKKYKNQFIINKEIDKRL